MSEFATATDRAARRNAHDSAAAGGPAAIEPQLRARPRHRPASRRRQPGPEETLAAAGPLESAMIKCPAGHWFTGPIESLTWEPATTTIRAPPEPVPATGPGSRIPGLLTWAYSAGGWLPGPVNCQPHTLTRRGRMAKFMLIKISLMAEITDADALRDAALKNFDTADMTSPDHPDSADWHASEEGQEQRREIATEDKAALNQLADPTKVLELLDGVPGAKVRHVSASIV